MLLTAEPHWEKCDAAEMTQDGNAHLYRGPERQQKQPGRHEENRRTPNAPARVEAEALGVGRVVKDHDGFVARGVSPPECRTADR